jgi:farnesyl-diphosphate farnesyltransferase
MTGPVTSRTLDCILKGVSRSIFLTLKVAPGPVRRQLGVGYLFCRAADTIADTRLLSRESRLARLRLFRSQFEADSPRLEEVEGISASLGPEQAIPQERELLRRLGECFEELLRFDRGDQALLRKLVATLSLGMEMDLLSFPPEESGETAALESDVDLDRYTYHVAGCVGEFWTELQVAHLRALAHWDLELYRAKGVRFGKGLQMTNILRDVDRDLAIGRSYFPRPRLEAAGVSAEELRAGLGRERLKPVLLDYLELTLEHYRAGWEYTLAIPRSVPRLRLACAWPLFLGLRTLALLAQSPNPYVPGSFHKVPRSEVYSILRRSICRVFSNRSLERMYRELEREVLIAL